MVEMKNPEISLLMSRYLFDYSIHLLSEMNQAKEVNNKLDLSLLENTHGKTIASAYFISLSVELSLKTYIPALKLKYVEETHDCWKIFINIPIDVRNTLSKNFLITMKRYSAAVISFVSEDDIARDSLLDIRNLNLKKTIKGTKNNFVKWQRILEYQDKQQINKLAFYPGINCALAETLLSSSGRSLKKNIISNESIKAKFGHSTVNKSTARVVVETAWFLSEPFQSFAVNFRNNNLDESDVGGRFPVSIVGAVLAIEQCIKLVIHTAGMKNIKNHDLASLFSQAPEKFQLKLKQRYDSAQATSSDRTQIELTLSRNKDFGPSFNPIGMPVELEDLLKENSESYVYWRYIWQFENDTNIKKKVVSLSALALLIDVLFPVLVQYLNEES